MQARKFLQGAVHWHAPFLLLILFLAVHSLSTFGVFVVSDDLAWVQRAAADAHKPWEAFGKPVFGDYYRPIPNLVWLMNYYLWDFDFDGHQLMFILMWLAGVCLVYAVGCRLGGRVAGFAAASLVGLNDVYLLISSWKSWYTTLTEFVVVLAWTLCFMEWLETRRRGYWTASAALAVIGLLSRELAPLIIAAAVLVAVILPAFKSPGLSAEASGAAPLPEADPAKAGFSRKRAIRRLVAWAVVTVAVLCILPSYRNSLKSLLGPKAGGGAEVGRAEYVWERFAYHASGILDFQVNLRQKHGYGILRFLVWSAAAFAALRARQDRPAFAARYRRMLIGAFLLGGILFALPWGADAFGSGARALATAWAEPIAGAIVLLIFCAVALAGDRWDRILGAWFLVSFVPVLFLEHKSGAYHLLAFTALALYTARKLAAFVKEELRPAAARLFGDAPAGPDDDARYILAGIFIALILGQALMLGANVRGTGPTIRARAAFGREREAEVNRAVGGVLRNAAPDRRVWVGRDTREEPARYAELAGLILQEKYGFTLSRLDRAEMVGLRAFDTALRVYTDAIPYEDAVFSKFNAYPNPGFEEEQPGLIRSPVARSGKYSLATEEAGARPRDVVSSSAPFRLKPDTGYVFGGFLRRDAESAGSVRMALRSVAGARYARETQPIGQSKPEWELAWECAAPPEESTRFIFRVVEAKEVRNGRILVDDVFLCPVEPLILAARNRK